MAERMAALIPGAIVEKELSYSGGGALPNQSLPTYAVVLTGASLNGFAAKLRNSEHPIVVRIQKDNLRIDPRTMLAGEWEIVLERINALRNEQD